MCVARCRCDDAREIDERRWRERRERRRRPLEREAAMREAAGAVRGIDSARRVVQIRRAIPAEHRATRRAMTVRARFVIVAARARSRLSCGIRDRRRARVRVDRERRVQREVRARQ